MRNVRIAGIRLLCPDPVATCAFYEAAFKAWREPDGLACRLGRERIEFARTGSTASALAPSNATAFQHLAIIVSEMDEAMRRLRSVEGWTAISQAGPERLPASSGAVTAFKFRDPDGHPLELLAFPDDAAPAPWQSRDGLFRGIDHTAITVADTERSVAFYRDLGFEVSSRGVNTGDEQARMDGVENPTVDVTGLTPSGGSPPRLELLCYRMPGTIQRPVEHDDGLATRILLSADEPAAEGPLPRSIVDPDGHRLVLPGHRV